MNQLIQLISLPVINIYDTKIEGIIEKIYINSITKKIEQLIVYNEDSDTYKTVLFSQIYKIGSESIFIKNSSKITLSENLQPLPDHFVFPINAKCYNFEGAFMGSFQDAHIVKNAISSITINNKHYSSSSIIAMSNNLILISQNSHVKISNFQPTKKIKKHTSNNNEEPRVNILNSLQPNKEITNYNFLINRVITKDIKNSTGEIIASKDTFITTKTINKLRSYRKLKELVLYSK